jgi:hypothetical protein
VGPPISAASPDAQAARNNRLDSQIQTISDPNDPGLKKWAGIATPSVTDPVLAMGTSANMRSGTQKNGEAHGSVVGDGNGGYKTVNLGVVGGITASIRLADGATASIHSHPLQGSSKMPSTSFNNALRNPLKGDTVSARSSGVPAIIVHRTGVTVFDPSVNSIYIIK